MQVEEAIAAHAMSTRDVAFSASLEHVFVFRQERLMTDRKRRLGRKAAEGPTDKKMKQSTLKRHLNTQLVEVD